MSNKYAYTDAQPTGTDHRHGTDRHVQPNRMHIETVVESSIIAHFSNDAVTAAKGAAAPSAATYVALFANSLGDYLNSDEWRVATDEAISCEFRPKGTDATSQQIVLASDRSVTFDPRTSIIDGSLITEGKAIAGDLVFTAPCPKAALFSHRFTILDHHVMAGFTAASLEQTAVQFLGDMMIACNTTVANVIGTSAGLRKVKAKASSGAAREQAEDLIDILAANIDTGFGLSLSHFTFMVPVALSPILDRAAQRAGLESIDELIGAGIQFHRGPNKILCIPNGYSCLSFREDRDGDIWNIRTSRNASLQGYDIEVSAIADVVANAMVKLKLSAPGSDKLQTELVAMPLITEIELTTA